MSGQSARNTRRTAQVVPGTLPNAPGDPGTLWTDGTSVYFYNGTSSQLFDFNEGPQVSLFGTPLGDV